MIYGTGVLILRNNLTTRSLDGSCASTLSTNVSFYLCLKQYQGRVFNARRMFRFGILCVQSMVRIRRLKFTPEPLSILVARRDPYRMKAVRKVEISQELVIQKFWRLTVFKS